jgi:hypothetical protein
MEPYKEYDFDPRNLPQDVLAAIGLVTACSAQTEHVVEMGIGGCAELDVEYSAAITTHMNAPLRDHVLRAVAQIRIENIDDLDELDRLLDKVNVAFSKRNDYVHHSWCRDPDTGKIFTNITVARGEVDAELIPMSVNQIKADAVLIYQAGMDLMSFLIARGLLPPFPARKRPRAHKSKAARKKRREMLRKKGGT